MLRKMRPVWLVLALALGIATLIGARGLTNGSSAGATGKTDAAPAQVGGTYVLGTVDTDPPPVAYGLPTVLQSGTITQVYVKEGDQVQVGQPLYEFDATIQKKDVRLAEAAVKTAQTKVKEAQELAKQHAESIKVAEKAVEFAERKRGLMKQHYELVEKGLEDYYRKVEKVPESEWPERKKSDTNLYKANVEYDNAVHDKTLAEQRRDQLKAADPQVKVEEAKAAVEQAQAALDKAKAAVELCVVKAKTAGTVEQVSISPGTTLGISTRTPALWIIPGGTRVVRAEIEAEFAHRVGPNIEGRTVTIFDHSDPKLTYTGTVRRVPPVFLLKRGNADSFVSGDTRVIEAVVEVTDPNPTGKPPLRVGQRVRVNLGQ